MQVQTSGVKVRGIVHDLGGKNRKVWKDLEIGPRDHGSHFVNPDDSGTMVYVFADVPHLLKLLVWNCMDNGFVLASGETLDKNDFIKMLDADSAEIKCNYKLSRDLLNLTHRERQNVSKAAKIFSNSTATLADLVFPQNTDKGRFIRLVNNWFDIFNSRTNKCPNLKAGFGTHYVEQVK